MIWRPNMLAREPGEAPPIRLNLTPWRLSPWLEQPDEMGRYIAADGEL